MKTIVKSFLKFNAFLFIILSVSVFIFCKTVYSTNEFSISKVEIDVENNIQVELLYTEDTANIFGFKIGVSCDKSDFRLGNILNLETNKYLSYLSGSWLDVPTLNLQPGQIFELKGKVFDSSKCDKAYLKIRAKKTTSSSYIDTPYADQITLTFIPTPPIVPSIIPTPTPSISITPDVSPSVTPLVEEESSDIEITEDIVLSATEKENIFISEFMPNPISNENEWVEIYNKNDHKVELKNWYIDDILTGGGTPFLFSGNIDKNSYSVFEITKSLLNNSEDSVSLLDENKNLIHKVSYKKTIQGSSIQKNLFDQKWYITDATTKGKENINTRVSPEISNSKTDKSQDLLATKSSDLNSETPSITITPSILGVANVIFPEIIEPTISIPIPKPPSRFTIEPPENNYYVLTEKELPNTFEVLLKFIERAFW